MATGYVVPVSAIQVIARTRAGHLSSPTGALRELRLISGLEQVGSYFIEQYYQILLQQPNFVHQFYTDLSTVVRIDGSMANTASGMLVGLSSLLSLRISFNRFVINILRNRMTSDDFLAFLFSLGNVVSLHFIIG